MSSETSASKKVIRRKHAEPQDGASPNVRLEIVEVKKQQLQKPENLDPIIGGIAHHLNNQLQSVMMNLDVLIHAHRSGEVPNVSLTEAMASARKAAEMNTLMLTCLGQAPGPHEPLDLSEVCRHHLPTLRAAMSKVKLDTDFLSPGPIVNANAKEIHQILTTLVTNANEALVEGRGIIRLTIQTMIPADIHATNRFPKGWQPQAKEYACLSIADSGCGILPQDIEKLFDPFFSTKYTDRGLGLSMVLGIVRTHHGVVTVESQSGWGSVFRVFLPVTPEAIPQTPETVAPIPHVREGTTILLVEDEPRSRKVVMLALNQLGFTVLTATNGVEAVKLFRKHVDHIHLVLCDLTMPRMNGWETLEALRQISPGIPVILSSGYSEAHVMADEHAEMPQAFLSKPYGFEELRDTIMRVLGQVKDGK